MPLELRLRERAQREDPEALAPRILDRSRDQHLADPTAGNALIKKDNPNMSDEQLAYGVGKLKEMGIITSGDAATQGIGVITRERLQKTHAFLVENGLIDANKVKLDQAYDFDLIRDIKVLP